MHLTKRLLTIDIETAAHLRNFYGLPETIQDLFEAKHSNRDVNAKSLAAHYRDVAPLNPFYGQVVSICTKATYEAKPRVSHQDSEVSEKELLLAFLKDLDDLPPYNFVLTGHAIKSFDISFLVTRMLAHNIAIPKILLTANAAKDWDNGKTFIDTNLPPFTSYGQRVKLTEWCMLLGINSPKDDLSGADVPAAFWRGEYERIAAYNAKDVETEEQVALRLIEAFIEAGIDPRALK